MNREDIFRWAREASNNPEEVLPEHSDDLVMLYVDELERFVALVAAAEREFIAAWVEDMCAGLDAKTIANGIRNGGNDDIQAFEVRK